MSTISPFGRFDFIASATKGIARFEIGNGHNHLISAVTTAHQTPDGRISILAKLGYCLRENSKFSEQLACVIYAGAH